MQDKSALAVRLHHLWEKPDFSTFFTKFAKRAPIKMKKGSTIFFEGDLPDKIFYIKKGYVKLFRLSESGRDSVIYLYGPGNILGLRALTSKDGILRHSAETLTDCEISSMSKEDYLAILADHPEYIIDLMHMFIQRLNNAERKLEGFILTDTTARVANFFTDCSKRFGVKNGKDTVLPIPFTHQKIADFVGAFRETATISLNKLIDEKIITFSKGVVTIINSKKLEQKTHILDNLED